MRYPAYIDSVKSVLDPNPVPPGIYQYSIIVSTPQREMKFTAPTKERHDIWFSVSESLRNHPSVYSNLLRLSTICLPGQAPLLCLLSLPIALVSDPWHPVDLLDRPMRFANKSCPAPGAFVRLGPTPIMTDGTPPPRRSVARARCPLPGLWANGLVLRPLST
jgi:hypothetical protein